MLHKYSDVKLLLEKMIRFEYRLTLSWQQSGVSLFPIPAPFNWFSLTWKQQLSFVSYDSFSYRPLYSCLQGKLKLDQGNHVVLPPTQHMPLLYLTGWCFWVF